MLQLKPILIQILVRILIFHILHLLHLERAPQSEYCTLRIQISNSVTWNI